MDLTEWSMQSIDFLLFCMILLFIGTQKRRENLKDSLNSEDRIKLVNTQPGVGI